MKRIVFSLFFMVVLSARADVVIYRLSQAQTWTGDGRTYSQTISSKLVFDPQAPASAKLFTWFPGKFYQVDCPYLVVKYMTGPRRSQQSAFFLDGHGFDTEGFHQSALQTFLRGTNSNVLIGPNSRLLIPKIARGTSHGVYRSAGGADIVGAANIIASYLGSETQAANAALKTVESIIADYAATAQSGGWSEVIADAPCE